MSEQLVARAEGQPLDSRQGPGTTTRRNLYITIAAAVLLIVAAFFTGGAIANGSSPKSAQSAATSQSNASAFMGLTNSSAPYDLRFIDEMVMHHQGAIMSVKQMLSDPKHPELRDLGNRIITTQQQQIDQMLAWRGQWYPDAPALNTADMDMGMDMMSGGMMSGGMMGGGMMSGAVTGSPSTTTDTHNHSATAPSSGNIGNGTGMGGMTTMTTTNSTAPDGNMMDGGMMGGQSASGDQADRMFLRMMIPHHQLAIDMAQDALGNAQHPELKTLAQSIISGQSAEITEMEGYLKTWYGEDSTRNLAAPMRMMMQGMMDGTGN